LAQTQVKLLITESCIWQGEAPSAYIDNYISLDNNNLDERGCYLADAAQDQTENFAAVKLSPRSEERRVGKESRAKWAVYVQAEDGIRDFHVTGVQTCALPIYLAQTQVKLLITESCIWQGEAPSAYIDNYISLDNNNLDERGCYLADAAQDQTENFAAVKLSP